MSCFTVLKEAHRLDNKATRVERKETDTAAPISEIFAKLVFSQLMYTPGEYCTVDKSLLPFRGRVKFRVYMPNKPGKYGIKLKEMLVAVVAKRLNVYETYKTSAKSTFLDPRFKKKGFGLDSNAKTAEQWVIQELSVIMSQQSPEEASAEPAPAAPETAGSAVPDDEDDLWECLDKKVAEVASSQTPVSSAIVAVNQYLEMPYLERKENPLEFWEQRKNLLPGLAEMAFKYLSIPATSVPSERLFSKAGLVTNDRRNRLHPKKLNELVFLNSWFTAQRRK